MRMTSHIERRTPANKKQKSHIKRNRNETNTILTTTSIRLQGSESITLYIISTLNYTYTLHWRLSKTVLDPIP